MQREVDARRFVEFVRRHLGDEAEEGEGDRRGEGEMGGHCQARKCDSGVAAGHGDTTKHILQHSLEARLQHVRCD